MMHTMTSSENGSEGPEHTLDLRLIIDSVPALINTSRPDGDLDFLNQAWLKFVGLPLEDILGWKWTIAIHPADVDGMVEALRRAHAKGENFEYEARVRRADGVYRWMLHRSIPQRDDSGNILKWYGSSIDIEDRRRVEEALRLSEAYLAEGQRLAHAGSWALDLASDKYVYVSDEDLRIWGFDPRDGSPAREAVFRRIHPEDRNRWKEKFEKSLHEKIDSSDEYRIVLPDGTVKHIHTIRHPVLNDAGGLVKLVGTSIDITERKRAEEAIRQSEVELRQTLDATPQHVAVLGTDRSRLYFNQAALDYYGWSLERSLTCPASDFYHLEDWEQANHKVQNAFSSGSQIEFEVRTPRHDGVYRWFLFRYKPLRDEQGHITRWIVTTFDIEDRKQAEERLQRENVALREEIDKASMFEEIVGSSPALHAVLSRVAKVAPTDSTVLITGETGTGKELIARAIHKRSRRASRAFVSVNCAAIPRDLIASELFGHEKGAFTGATQRRLGRFELAEGGTIFLDEIAELPAETQVALLRVLQEREFERVGGDRTIRCDVRVIAATNRNLEAGIAAGDFRRDLFYRLNVFPIEMPPLRKRKEDIPLLVEYFIDRYARKAGKSIRQVSKKSLELLQSYPWPGNIRELQNIIERSVIVCETESFSVDESWLSSQPLATEPGSQVGLSQMLAAQEKETIEAALKECGGRVSGPSGAAARLSMPRSTLESKIRSLDIDKNRFKTQ
jgi:formate hydrogenlyase transcriptional activator